MCPICLFRSHSVFYTRSWQYQNPYLSIEFSIRPTVSPKSSSMLDYTGNKSLSGLFFTLLSGNVYRHHGPFVVDKSLQQTALGECGRLFRVFELVELCYSPLSLGISNSLSDLPRREPIHSDGKFSLTTMATTVTSYLRRRRTCGLCVC